MAKGIVIQITGDGAGAARALELVDKHLRETAHHSKESASEIGEAMEKIKSRLEMVGIDFALFETINKLRELVTQTLEFGEAIQKAHEQTGMEVETLSLLHYAAAITGTEFDSLTGAVSKMDKTIGAATQGDKKAQAFMKALGLNAKELAERSDGAEIAFRKFTATMAATENPIRRVELATSLLGKAGASQIPMLLQVGEHWDEFKQKAQAAGVLLTGETAASLAATNQRLNDMKQHILGASLAFTQGLTPGLVQLFGVIAGGKGPMASMQTWGENVAKMMAFAGSAIYSAAAAAELLFATFEGGRFSEGGRKDLAAYKDLLRQAQEMHDIAFNKNPAPEPKPFMSKAGGEHNGHGFGGVGDITTPKKNLEPIAAAATALVEAQATAMAMAQKSADDLLLVQMEANHKLRLTSDADYYREKLSVQKDALEAEAGGMRNRIAALQALEAKQHEDKKLTRDKSGNSAEELKAARQIVQLNQQLNALEEKRKALDINADLASRERADAIQLATLKAAAKVEEQTNTGIAARLQLMQYEQKEAMEKVRAEAGAGSEMAKQTQALQDQEKVLLRIGEVEHQIRTAEATNTLATNAQKDKAEKDPMQRRNATKEINALNKETAATLTTLVAQYDALAASLGGDFIEKARALHAELDKLNTPDKKEDAQFAKTLGEGVESMASQMVSATAQGRNAFRQMAQSIEQDILRLAVKLAFQKWLTPMLMGAVGGVSGSSVPAGGTGAPFGDPGHAGGGDMSAPGLVGEKGPEVFFPKGPGTVMPNDALMNLAKNSGGGAAPNVTMNITNASSQPVTARQTGTSFDADMKAFVIHTILEDHASGGPISSASQGGG